MVIQSALADIPCANLGMSGVLKELNATLGTSYTLDNPILPSIFESFIRQDYDFGTLYANLHPFRYDLTTVECIRQSWNRDQEMRQNQVNNNRISDGNIPPRRIWDLYANRVVPYWITWPSRTRGQWKISVISHAWMSEEERMDVWTPINGFEWPVPIPKDANLNLIRIEMLNLGVHYVWLDVLCLRQEGGKREDLRREEWKVDVPTIGSIYRNCSRDVVYYLSGLGRPFCLKPEDLRSDWCWFRRAWMLQEVKSIMPAYVIGGEAGNRWICEDVRARVDKHLQSLRLLGGNLFDILQEMQNQVSTKPLDKVAGLGYLLFRESIPIYDESQSEEDAWVALTEVMDGKYHLELLLLYPEPGNGYKCWQPSWNEVMAMVTIPKTRMCLQSVDLQTDETGVDWYWGPCIKLGNLRGLGKVSSKIIPRQGELLVKDHTGLSHVFKIIADHTYLIPDSPYTLIGMSYSPCYYDETSLHWAVGHQ
ncbi:uncharacterized protein EV420DRAFT_1280684 [Desarmillaria tabescens]|uniref:Heterokaryon incompatibility domain-containing protein n=1 Tax=Armillaria tabescens TaxID=1929756 RepID=A0AA39J770_ARMTA|nr:uncharacterized protein EV420DRAFT_1280684 [Desarmillaria tabescens]KAK0437425.1 hypothetical protein EV420DRAFT_1280684 [Desarmillaria tabescens]